MRLFLFFISIGLLSSCASNENDISIFGTWGSCNTVSTDIFAYEEIILGDGEFQNTIYGSDDNQCINIQRPPLAAVITTRGSYILGDPYISDSGLEIYDIDFIDAMVESNLGLSATPDFFTIMYVVDERMYFGAITTENDAGSVEKRPTEINFNAYFEKK